MGRLRIGRFAQHFRWACELAVLQHQSSGVFERQPLLLAAKPHLLCAQVFVPIIAQVVLTASVPVILRA